MLTKLVVGTLERKKEEEGEGDRSTDVLLIFVSQKRNHFTEEFDWV